MKKLSSYKLIIAVLVIICIVLIVLFALHIITPSSEILFPH